MPCGANFPRAINLQENLEEGRGRNQTRKSDNMNALKEKVGETKPSFVPTALRVKVGPERIILGDGLQPFGFRTRKGTLYLQAQTSPTPGFKLASNNPIPGYGHFASVVSRNHGKTW